MNFPGQQIYAYDHHHQSFQLHNSNSVEYIQSLPPQVINNSSNEQTADSYGAALTSGQLMPGGYLAETPTYMPVYDPGCQTYMAQLQPPPPPPPLNSQLYPTTGSYHYSPYPPTAAAADNYVGYFNSADYYRTLMSYSQMRPYLQPQLNYQTNQIAVLNNIQVNTDETYSCSMSSEPVSVNKDLAKLPSGDISGLNRLSNFSADSTNSRGHLHFKNPDNSRRVYKSMRNKSKSVLSKQNISGGPSDLVTRNSKSSFMLNSIAGLQQQQQQSLADDLIDGANPASGGDQSVELLVTNLDYNISGKEWKKLLYNQFQNAIKRVLNVYIQTQPDGSNCAVVRVASMEDARLAISQFHRKKIGYKRIQVNLVNSNMNVAPSNIKQEVASLLKSVAGYSLSVFKFMELYEKRYHRNISISDFYKMRDFVEIKDVGGNQNGKIISLTNAAINYVTQSAPVAATGQSLESLVCVVHCPEGSEEYAAALETASLPHVRVRLSVFKEQVHQLLRAHNGALPLVSFLLCYQAMDYNDVQVLSASPPLPLVALVDETVTGSQSLLEEAESKDTTPDHADVTGNRSCDGVPLEHLLTCVTGVRILTGVGGVKKIQWEEKKVNGVGGTGSSGSGQSAPSPAVAAQNIGLGGVLVDRLHQFSREVVDLMKHQPRCQMLLSKFIPGYHHHFGKQCRVADYGFSKLHELIEALPHVVHVVGAGYARTLHLAHKVQLRRFTNELMKLLKAQASKTCALTEYAGMYRALFHKDFCVTDYGVCFIEDLLEEIPDSTVDIVEQPICTASTADADDRVSVPISRSSDGDPARPESSANNAKTTTSVAPSGSDTATDIPATVVYISMPKRVQTQEEKERTAQFALEVVDLLRQSPRCRLPFNKFIPSYHHHFSRQCKVAEYGFTKLIELLDAVPDVVQIFEEHGEKFVVVTQREMMRVFAEQTLSMLEKSYTKSVSLPDFVGLYQKHQGYSLNLEDYGATSLIQLILRIFKVARLHRASSSSQEDLEVLEEPANTADVNVCLADRSHIKYQAHKLLLVLLDVPSGGLPDFQFLDKYRYRHHENPNMLVIQNDLQDIVEVYPQDTQPLQSSSSTSPEALASAVTTSSSQLLQLRPLVLLARDLRDLLRYSQGKLPLAQLESCYEQQFGRRLRPTVYGFPCTFSLLQACDFVVSVKGRGCRATLVLNQDYVGKLAYRVAFSVEPIASVTLDQSDSCVLQSAVSQSSLQPTSDAPAMSSIMSASSVSRMPSSGVPNNYAVPCTPTATPSGIYSAYNPSPPSNGGALYSPSGLYASQPGYPHPLASYYNPQPLYNPWLRPATVTSATGAPSVVQASPPAANWYCPGPPTVNPYRHHAPPPASQHQYHTSTVATSAPHDFSPFTPHLPYVTATSEDQKQIDELVETLAYDNATMTPPPASASSSVSTIPVSNIINTSGSGGIASMVSTTATVHQHQPQTHFYDISPWTNPYDTRPGLSMVPPFPLMSVPLTNMTIPAVAKDLSSFVTGAAPATDHSNTSNSTHNNTDNNLPHQTNNSFCTQTLASCNLLKTIY